MLEALQAMHRELVKLREEVAELRRLPAPTQPPELTEKAPEAEQAPASTDDDPHGFRAMVRAMRAGQQ